MVSHFSNITFLHYFWGEVFVAVFFAFLSTIIVYRILQYARLQVHRDGIRLFGDVFCWPATLGSGCYACLGVVQIFLQSYPFYVSCITLVRSSGLTLLIAYLCFVWQEKYQAFLLKKYTNQSDRMLVDTFGKVGAALIVFIAVTIVLHVLGIPMHGILAVGGIGGLAMSWAAKDIIANFFGGFMVIVNQPFVIGDWIRSRNRNFEGLVNKIGWYHTTILSVDRLPVTIPNALLTDAMIENAGQNYAHRIKKTLHVSLSDIDCIDQITSAIRSFFANHEYLDHRQANGAFLVDVGPASLQVVVTCYTKPMSRHDFLGIQQNVLCSTVEIIKKHGASIVAIMPV